eukprot:TRINITY_DN55138_c0_g1_i1.p1 TRINITY_DN55138_c0_g1~~TRINITY_DN55138_c0_g1_i1.p1  ORF type:complete len:261 (-),score=32.70 TRINITY_DN55138_c0_g1_i1:58-840(-)
MSSTLFESSDGLGARERCSTKRNGVKRGKKQLAVRDFQNNGEREAHDNILANVVHREVDANFVKTRMCRFNGLGICTRGDLCTFAHHRSEVRSKNVRKTKFCSSVIRGEQCKNPACKNRHDSEDLYIRDGENRSFFRANVVGHQEENVLVLRANDDFATRCFETELIQHKQRCAFTDGTQTFGSQSTTGDEGDTVNTLKTDTLETFDTVNQVAETDVISCGQDDGLRVIIKNTFICVVDGASEAFRMRRVLSVPCLLSST